MKAQVRLNKHGKPYVVLTLPISEPTTVEGDIESLLVNNISENDMGNYLSGTVQSCSDKEMVVTLSVVGPEMVRKAGI